jgi:hypothetical protein
VLDQCRGGKASPGENRWQEILAAAGSSPPNQERRASVLSRHRRVRPERARSRQLDDNDEDQEWDAMLEAAEKHDTPHYILNHFITDISFSSLCFPFLLSFLKVSCFVFRPAHSSRFMGCRSKAPIKALHIPRTRRTQIRPLMSPGPAPQCTHCDRGMSVSFNLGAWAQPIYPLGQFLQRSGVSGTSQRLSGHGILWSLATRYPPTKSLMRTRTFAATRPDDR